MADVTISKDTFGKTTDGIPVERFTLQNAAGIKIQILTLGGIIQKLFTPSRDGKLEDIVTGYDDLTSYEENPCYFGSIIGRSANRINKGKFTIDGEQYSLPCNNPPNHLHGGEVGFHKRHWRPRVDGTRLTLEYTSPDGEEGYPGKVDIAVTYELTNDNELLMGYSATTSKPTPINVTIHPYFNLAGHKHADICDQVITIPSVKFTPKDGNGIPTGEIANVAGSVFDLRGGVTFGKHVKDVPGDLGYDHNFCVQGDEQLNLAARVEEPVSGRVLELYTSSPGVHLYTANYVDVTGKDGTYYGKHCSFALETQNYPDAINKPNFPNAVLRPGETYSYSARFKFSTQSGQ